MPEDYLDLIASTVLHDDRLIEAAIRHAGGKTSNGWSQVTIRPVMIKGERFLQFSTYDGIQDVAKNFREPESGRQLQALLSQSLKSIQVTTTQETIRVQFSKKGRPILHRQLSKASIPLDLAHDRRKPYLLAEGQPVPFLHAIGVMTAEGRVRADQQRKFRQINEFLRIMDESGEISAPNGRQLRVADLGCGSAALTFATYHYLHRLKDIPTIMTGVDTKGQLMDRLNDTATGLGWPDLTFETARIAEFEPPDGPIDIVLALHACDTATDEALARAVEWQSQYIFSAPCCHHHLQAQLAQLPAPVPLAPILRHGILFERMGDILTDTFRALILRLLGYRTDVLEFIPIEHTPKNLMIRAIRSHTPASGTLIEEYRQLKDYWGVTPYLESLLQERLEPILKG